MKLKWSSKAISDLDRLHDFLAGVNPSDAARIIQNLVAAPKKPLDHPRLGERLDEFSHREIRRFFIGDYELQYEMKDDNLFLLRVLWHTRENRL